MTHNENILVNRLLWVLSDLNSNLDAETVEMIFHDLSQVTGKTQNDIATMLADLK